MKKMTKLTAVSMAAVLAAASLTACGSSTTPVASSAAETKAEAAGATEAAKEESAAPADGVASDKQLKVGICQLVQHSALDAATKGFIDVLKEEYGDNVFIDEQNAQGDSATCTTIINGFVSNEYDLILANATPALQSAMNATQDIPILGTSVTDYGTALAMDNFDASKGTGINISGTSDLAPLDQQEDMILELVPDVKNVSILYCSAEANSQYQASQIEKYLEEDGIAYKEFTFSDSNDLQSVVQSAVADCDAMYIPTDNTAASNMTVINNIVQPAGIPIICGEENMMKSGALATLSISYEDLGRATGKQAIEILSNGADVSTMPIAYAEATTKEYNKAYADAIGITIPDSYTAVE
ncbi:putative ABC transport system substrate-binding protein [Oribacterium sp. KHPX15]|uniref:ABC transporter substrate-binding protein n=1 Tax=Oribacterium sp. KHPX15 TaxID=1855342 RepID=UPI000894FDA1|nr:ABC transporter substrate-binding protein [Oribacterium sp. KHPX15]SDZ87145.1 putative ABC transport system substrate-binding protein [Oribacterium sp. KHPX15]